MKNSGMIGVVVLVALAYLFRSQLSALFSSGSKTGTVVQGKSTGSPTFAATFGFPTGLFAGTSYGATTDAIGRYIGATPAPSIFPQPIGPVGPDGTQVTYGQNLPTDWDPFANGPGI